MSSSWNPAPGSNAHHIRLQNLTITGNYSAPYGNANVVLVTGTSAGSIGFNEFLRLTLKGGPVVVPGNDFSAMFYIQTSEESRGWLPDP